eukprot:CAMPEP_0195282084 /NCGR_PEP_ID=MMETSP0707-20130614/1123_1 /TAXON_ID=33640 /ORGANISM="Asterionellopsis glacialis, Strain CCMP134" /LENGTH=954 /DNA_ID=CAMNT_0040341035 /DNA_START=38 /DNA_END=2902 /DNA_ORIENTATION=-
MTDENTNQDVVGGSEDAAMPDLIHDTNTANPTSSSSKDTSTTTPTKPPNNKQRRKPSPSRRAAELRRKLREKEEELNRLREELNRSMEDSETEDEEAADEDDQVVAAEENVVVPLATPVKELRKTQEGETANKDEEENEKQLVVAAAAVVVPSSVPQSPAQVVEKFQVVPAVVEDEDISEPAPPLLATPVKQGTPQQERFEDTNGKVTPLVVAPPPTLLANVDSNNNSDAMNATDQRQHLVSTIADEYNGGEESPTAAAETSVIDDTALHARNSVAPPSPFVADESPVKEKFDYDQDLRQTSTGSTMDESVEADRHDDNANLVVDAQVHDDGYDIETGKARQLEDPDTVVEKAILAGATAASAEMNDKTLPLDRTAEESYDDSDQNLLSASGSGDELPHHKSSTASQVSDTSNVILSADVKRKRRCLVVAFALIVFIGLGALVGALMAANAETPSDSNNTDGNSKNPFDGPNNGNVPAPTPTPTSSNKQWSVAPSSANKNGEENNGKESEYYGTWSVSPSVAPTRKSLEPSAVPTTSHSPSASPTGMPSASPTAMHSIHPTMQPTNSPLAEVIAEATGGNVDFLSDVDAPSFRAYHIMIDQEDMKKLLVRLPTDLAHEEPGSEDTTTGAATTRLFEADDPLGMTVREKIVQRFAALTVYLAASDSNIAMPDDECTWNMVVCSDHVSGAGKGKYVTELQMARFGYTGHIATEVGLLKALQLIDAAENELDGSIPEELYELSNMKYLYLEHNKLTGTLSEGIANLYEMESLYLGHNELTGPLPQGLKSKNVNNIRPLRYLSVHHNKMSGSVPEALHLRRLFYLDLSFNNFSGQLPASMFERHYAMRHLYLEHNKFSGALPATLPGAGNGRLTDAFLNDNEFTGDFPDGYSKENTFLLTLNIQNTQIEGFDKDICKMSVHDSGELVELGAHCDICQCDPLCDRCYEDGASDEWTFKN